MNQRICLLFSFISICFFSTSSIAQNTGCSAHGSTAVDEQAAGTIAYPASFVLRSGEVVPFTALSRARVLAQYSDPSLDVLRSDVCIFYQIKNNATEKIIESLRWPVAGLRLYTFPIEPGGLSMAFPVTFLDTVGIFNGWVDIAAFRAQSITVRALRPIFLTTELPNSEGPHPLGPSPAPARLPDLPRQFEMDPETDFSITTPNELDVELPEIEINLITPDEVPIEYRSAIFFDGEKIEFSYRFASDDAQSVSTPYLAALREYLPSASVSDAISIAASIDSFTTNLSGEGGVIEFSFFVDPQTSEFDDTSIFLTHHPISVSTEAGQLCLLYPIYSPIPVRIGEEFCTERMQ